MLIDAYGCCTRYDEDECGPIFLRERESARHDEASSEIDATDRSEATVLRRSERKRHQAVLTQYGDL